MTRLQSGAFIIAISSLGCSQGQANDDHPKSAEVIHLPSPKSKGPLSLEEALAQRRSVRSFREKALDRAELSQLLWAAQGITDRKLGLRTAPSAGALYPLEVYVSIRAGVFHYEPQKHVLRLHVAGDLRQKLARAALNQESVRDAPAVFVVAGVYQRAAKKYGSRRAARYVHLEAGHAAQNLLLQAVALGLATVPVGALDEEAVQRALSLPTAHKPLYLIPVGHPAP